jgi:phosphatidate cytidylyltransferase
VTRILSALVLLPTVLGLIWWFPPVATLGLCLVVVVLASHEYESLAGRAGLQPIPWLPTVVTVVSFLLFATGTAPLLPMLLGPGMVGALMVLRGEPKQESLGEAAAALFPVLYLAVPVATVVLIRGEFGPGPLIALIGTQVASDTAQYYTGRLLGRTPLAPAVSPKKTWEGAIGGLVAGAVILPAFGAWWLPGLSPLTLAAFGAGLAVVGILGDLFESLIKRSVHVKDASGLIPGHGGMLDRIDALIFTTPVYYVVLSWLLRGQPVA